MVQTSELTSFNCTGHPSLLVQDRSQRSYCYNCVIEGFQTPAYNLARRMLNDPFLAEDALQEGFFSGYRGFANFRGDNLRAWIMQIVANTCRDMLRARRARPVGSLDPLPADPGDENPTRSVAELPSRLESPEAYVERQELREAIEAGLGSLAEDQRLAVLLVDVQGMSYEETAIIMGCSLGTVKSRLSRGRRGLRDYLRPLGNFYRRNSVMMCSQCGL